MAIDFTLSPELEAIRDRVRTFINEVVKPGEAAIEGHQFERRRRLPPAARRRR